MSQLIQSEQAAQVSTPSAGKVAFYTDNTGTPVPKVLDDGGSARNSVTEMFSVVPAGDFALQTAAGVQSAFPTTGDVITLQASTAYFFEGQYLITHTTTTCTAAMAFLAGGGLTITSIAYEVDSVIAVANAAPIAGVQTWVNQLATTIVTATSTAGWIIRFQGIIRVNAGGTLTPQINWSAATTAPIMKVDSYIRFFPLGTSTTNVVGPIA